MLDRDVRLARKIPEDAADEPAACEIRVEREGTLDQRRHGADVLSEIGQREGGLRQNARIVAGYFQRAPCELGALQSVSRRIFGPTVHMQPKTAVCGPGQSGPVA